MNCEQRINAYFAACSSASATDIASHFSPDAVIYDTNIRPISGAGAIGEMWVKVRDRWHGASWQVDSCVAADQVAAIEWSMTGTSGAGKAFTFRGSEHYRFDEHGIAEIRQYWTFDAEKLDTGLIGLHV